MSDVCREVAPLVAARSLGVLERSEELRVKEHLQGCAECSGLASDVDEAFAGGALEPVAAPEGALEKIVGEAARRAAPPLTVRVSVGCSYCKGALERDGAVYCARCLAPHHEDCFGKHGRCATHGCGETRTVQPADVRPRALAFIQGVGAAAIASILIVAGVTLGMWWKEAAIFAGPARPPAPPPAPPAPPPAPSPPIEVETIATEGPVEVAPAFVTIEGETALVAVSRAGHAHVWRLSEPTMSAKRAKIGELGDVFTGLTALDDGDLLLGTTEGAIRFSPRWMACTVGVAESTAPLAARPIVAGGKVIVADTAGFVRAYSLGAFGTDGLRPLWERGVEAPIRLDGDVRDGKVSFRADDGRIYAFDVEDGRASDPIEASEKSSSSARISVAPDKSSVVWLDDQAEWKVPADARVTSPLAIDGERVAFGTSACEVVVLTRKR